MRITGGGTPIPTHKKPQLVGWDFVCLIIEAWFIAAENNRYKLRRRYDASPK